MKSREYRYHTLDVFTATPFCGNPLAVFPDASGLNHRQMQRIAAELHLSETIFLLPAADPAHTRRARIFTPAAELPFAGHPTIGAAYLLAATGGAPREDDEITIILEEGVGPVPVRVTLRHGAPVRAQLTAAQRPEFRDVMITGAALADLLALPERDTDALGLTPQAVSCGVPFFIAPVATRAALERARLHHDAWERMLSPAWARSVFVFAAEDVQQRREIRARMFAPELGVTEDPATGSAAAAFAAYLAARDDTPHGTLSWTIRQGVEMGRPSTLWAEADKRDGGIAAVRVAGEAVTIATATLHVLPED